MNGPAIAGGFDVAVMCDLRVVANTATFAHPEVRFGDVVRRAATTQGSTLDL